jgi:hypothetical protein
MPNSVAPVLRPFYGQSPTPAWGSIPLCTLVPLDPWTVTSIVVSLIPVTEEQLFRGLFG